MPNDTNNNSRLGTNLDTTTIFRDFPDLKYSSVYLFLGLFHQKAKLVSGTGF